MTESEQKVYDILAQLNINYEKHEHMPVYTMEELNLVDFGIKGEDCKNLFIKNRKGDQHFLVIVPSAKRIDLKKLGEEIGATGLSFASEERLKKYLGLTAGAVSPFGLINDIDKEVNVVVDQSLTAVDYVNFHPNVNTATLTLAAHDFFRFLHWCQNKILYVNLVY
ncbi:MAG: prolyl-tRNA synthetase associated domain-containing protein [Dehalobacterium sp.]